MERRNTSKASPATGLAPLIGAVLRPWRKDASPSIEEAAHLALGRRGEAQAARFLKRKGYKILRRNFRAPKGGEIDIVCRDKRAGVLAFVEVKTRSSEEFGRPLDAVDRRKRRLIIRAAIQWLRMLDFPDVPYRFDVVEVIAEDPPIIRLVQDAFHLPPWMIR